MVGFRLFTCFPMNLCSEYLFLHNISTLTRPAPQALSSYRYQISSFHSADVVEFFSLEEDGRVAAIAVFLNCFACNELWATSEFALV